MSSSRIIRKRGQTPSLSRRKGTRHEKKLSGDPFLLGAGYAAFAGWGPFRGLVPTGGPHAGDILLRVFIESLHIKRLLASDYYSTIDVADVDWSGRRVALTWQTRVGPGDAGGPGGRGGDTD
eukprot:1189804-Prorocentrum_minimum.AAC.1